MRHQAANDPSPPPLAPSLEDVLAAVRRIEIVLEVLNSRVGGVETTFTRFKVVEVVGVARVKEVEGRESGDRLNENPRDGIGTEVGRGEGGGGSEGSGDCLNEGSQDGIGAEACGTTVTVLAKKAINQSPDQLPDRSIAVAAIEHNLNKSKLPQNKPWYLIRHPFALVQASIR
jgi:hypothetical protein